jgi:hypothetical protein
MFGITRPGPPEAGGKQRLELIVEFEEGVEHVSWDCALDDGNMLPMAFTNPGSQVPIDPMTVRKIREETRIVLAAFLARRSMCGILIGTSVMAPYLAGTIGLSKMPEPIAAS